MPNNENEFTAESPENYEQKTICCFVLDVSGSMDGRPIEELNQGLQEFYQDISGNSVTANRLEVAVVKFSSSVETIIQPSLVDGFTMPVLSADGSTKLVDGVREAIALVESRKEWYKQTGQPHLRPWIILITDGAPDPKQDLEGLAQEIKIKTSNDKEHGKKFVFLAIGVEKANMQMLKQISNPEMRPAKLQGLKFSEFFRWLSASMASIAGSADGDKVDFPSSDDWMQGWTVS
jgi:uncharacterized protein YegL